MAATGAGMLPRSALTAIANAVRQQNGSDEPYTPGELASAVAALDGSSSGGAQLDSAEGDGLVPRSALEAIADAIRAQNGGEDRYTPLEMPDAILALTWGPARKFWGIYHEDDTLEIAWRAEPTSDLPSPIAELRRMVQ